MPVDPEELQRDVHFPSPAQRVVDRLSPDDVLTTPQSASYVGQSSSQLNKLRGAGGGPEFYRLGRAIRYRRRALDAWLEQHVAHSTSEPRAEDAQRSLLQPALREAIDCLLQQVLPDLVRELLHAEAPQVSRPRSKRLAGRAAVVAEPIARAAGSKEAK